MSSNFVNSHQCVGLNRVGKYLQPARRLWGAGVPPAGQSLGQPAGGTPAPHNEPWRRWTGMVGADATRLSWKERKRGIRRLLKRIEMKIVVTTSVVKDAATSVVKTKRLKSLLQSEWTTDLDAWARTRAAGRSLESICVEFGISNRQLNALTREYNSMSASEIIDGYKIGGLRKILGAQLREAAFSLWGAPGEFAKRRCLVPQASSLLDYSKPASRAGRMPAVQTKRSRYFRTRPSEFFGVLPGDEERLRISELLGKLDVLREELDWRVDNLALQLGFENAGAFRRACLNVMGRTLEQLERILAKDVVDYYLAAEDKELRELARRSTGRLDSLPHIYAAREIYCGDAEVKPEAPYLDRWSAAKFAKPEWIKAMRMEFG